MILFYLKNMQYNLTLIDSDIIGIWNSGKILAKFKCSPIKSSDDRMHSYKVESVDSLPNNQGLRNIFNSDERVYYTHRLSKTHALKLAHELALAYFEANLKSQGDLNDNSGLAKKCFDFSKNPSKRTPNFHSISSRSLQAEFPESVYIEPGCNCPPKPIIIPNDLAEEL